MDQNSGAGEKREAMTDEEKYWREHHAQQSHPEEGHEYHRYAPAYRIGHEAVTKYPGKSFDEIEESVALDYQQNEVGSAAWSPQRTSRAAPAARFKLESDEGSGVPSVRRDA